MGVLFHDLIAPTFVRYEISGASHLGTLVKSGNDFKLLERDDLGLLWADTENGVYKDERGQSIDIVHAVVGDVIFNGFRRSLIVTQRKIGNDTEFVVTKLE